jgi:hypothetical protein
VEPTKPANRSPQFRNPNLDHTTFYAHTGITNYDTISAFDPDGDPITYSVHGAPAGLILLDSIFSFSATLQDSALYETYNVSIADNHGNSDSIQRMLVVQINHRPAFDPSVKVKSSTVVIGKSYNGYIDAFDRDGDTVMYSVLKAPASFSFQNGKYVFTPGNSDLGTQSVVITASDKYGASDTMQWIYSIVPLKYYPLVSIKDSTSWVYYYEDPAPYIAETAYVAISKITVNAGDTVVQLSYSLSTDYSDTIYAFSADSDSVFAVDTVTGHKDTSFQVVFSVGRDSVHLMSGNPGQYNPFWSKNSFSLLDVGSSSWISYKTGSSISINNIANFDGDSICAVNNTIARWGSQFESTSWSYGSGYGLISYARSYNGYPPITTKLVSYNLKRAF